jgi:hypothetical protein
LVHKGSLCKGPDREGVMGGPGVVR